MQYLLLLMKKESVDEERELVLKTIKHTERTMMSKATLAPSPCATHSTVRHHFQHRFELFCTAHKNRHIATPTSYGRISTQGRFSPF